MAKILVALGGNAIVREGAGASVGEQRSTLRRSLVGVVELIALGHRVVITHGNGPQVGHILIRVEEARGKAYDLPLDVCVAQSQGEIGYLIQECLEELCRRRGIHRAVSVILTRSVVDPNDPRMRDPTKPVGPFYTGEKAHLLAKEKGFRFVEDSHRGYRRVVPSPMPLRIVEAELIGRLFEQGVIVVAAGGGGIPVWEERGSHAGVEAVVDKDFASSVLGVSIGVEKILDLTAVECVKLDFGSPQEKDIRRMTVTEAKRYFAEGHFAPGSMGPKIEAATKFLEGGGREVIITLPELALEGFAGRAGTHIYPDR